MLAFVVFLWMWWWVLEDSMSFAVFRAANRINSNYGMGQKVFMSHQRCCVKTPIWSLSSRLFADFTKEIAC